MSAHPTRAVSGRPATGTRWLLNAALLAFALRVLVPVGYMPAAADGWPVQLCPDGLSSAAIVVLLGVEPGHHHDGHAHAGHAAPSPHDDTAARLAGSCDFSSGAAGCAPPVWADAPLPAPDAADWLPPAPRTSAAATVFPHFFSRAPPSTRHT